MIIRFIASFINKLLNEIYLAQQKKRPPHTPVSYVYQRSYKESSDFIYSHLDQGCVFRSRSEMHDYVVEVLKRENSQRNSFCEFGVAQGKSICFFSSQLPAMKFFGFDSFEGLKEDWKGSGKLKGSYSSRGILPSVPKNVTLLSGWFDESIPEAIQNNIIHITLA